MTRWARNKSAQKHGKLPSESTPWSQLKTPLTANHQNPSNLSHNATSKDEGNIVNMVLQSTKRSKKQMDPTKTRPTALESRKRLNSFTVTHFEPKREKIPVSSESIISEDVKPKHGNVPRKSPKKGKIQPNTNKQKAIQQPTVLTDEEKLERAKKQDEFRNKRAQKRIENGIQLLSPKVERKLYNMKRGMRKKGISENEIKEMVRKFRRQQELLLRKDNNMLCLRCRKPGHRVADCKEITEDHEQSMGVCFKCGSTEHKLSQCTVSDSKIVGLPFAKCFVCDGLGHLSGTCPKNPKGKYPKGGSCKICGSVNHFANDCPNENVNSEEEPVVSTLVQGISADLDVDDLNNKTKYEKPHKKYISF